MAAYQLHEGRTVALGAAPGGLPRSKVFGSASVMAVLSAIRAAGKGGASRATASRRSRSSGAAANGSAESNSSIATPTSRQRSCPAAMSTER